MYIILGAVYIVRTTYYKVDLHTTLQHIRLRNGCTHVFCYILDYFLDDFLSTYSVRLLIRVRFQKFKLWTIYIWYTLRDDDTTAATTGEFIS
jgi:hypothetical protein